MITPDIYVKDFIDVAIERIKVNYEAARDAGDHNISFLRFLFRNQQQDGYHFFDNAVRIFTRGDNDSDKLKVFYSWEKGKRRVPRMEVHVVSDVMTTDFLGQNKRELVARNEGSGAIIDTEVYRPEFRAMVKVSCFSKTLGEIRLLQALLRSILMDSQVYNANKASSVFFEFKSSFAGFIKVGESEEMYRWDTTVGYTYLDRLVSLRGMPTRDICDFTVCFDINE